MLHMPYAMCRCAPVEFVSGWPRNTIFTQKKRRHHETRSGACAVTLVPAPAVVVEAGIFRFGFCGVCQQCATATSQLGES